MTNRQILDQGREQGISQDLLFRLLGSPDKKPTKAAITEVVAEMRKRNMRSEE